MKISEHAQRRCQMRGIPQECLDIVLRHGTSVSLPGGATAYHLSEKGIRAATTDCHHLIKAIERARHTTVVLSDDDNICITAYKNPKPIKRLSGK